MKLQDLIFWLGLLVATIIALFISPGCDLLVWHFLHPQGFWQRVVLIVLEGVTLFPRGIGAFVVWVFIGKLFAEISK